MASFIGRRMGKVAEKAYQEQPATRRRSRMNVTQHISTPQIALRAVVEDQGPFRRRLIDLEEEWADDGTQRPPTRSRSRRQTSLRRKPRKMDKAERYRGFQEIKTGITGCRKQCGCSHNSDDLLTSSREILCKVLHNHRRHFDEITTFPTMAPTTLFIRS